MDVFNLQAKIGLDVDEYLNGIKAAVNSSKKLVDAVNQMAQETSVIQTQVDKASKSMQDAAGNVDALGKSTNGAVSQIDKMSDAIEGNGDAAKNTGDKTDKLTDSIKNEENQTEKAIAKASSFSAKLQELKNKLEIAHVATKTAHDNVAKLREEFNRSAKETGTTSEKTKQLAVALDKAEDELKQCRSAEKKLNDEMKSLKGKTKEAGEEAEKSGSKFEKFGEKLKSAAENVKRLVTEVAKISTAIVGAATTGITTLTKQSLDAYGTYEQLASGAQKIFDSMDFSIIAKDAANAYKDLNMSANQYYEAINLAGATFAQTMGDKKGYETARTGMLAIADYASGTGRSLDELNQKYQLITRAASSYQSIADQFSGILPATSADFLEQAQKAGYLSDSYKKLTEVPIAQYQEAVTKMLENGVEALGLSGNTARESAETITGSMATVRAAWQNLLTGFGREDANLSELSSNLIDSISAVASNIAPRIGKILEGIGAALPVLIPKMYEQAKKLIADNASSFVSSVGSLLSSGGKVVGNILNDVISALPEQLPAALDTAGRFITDGLSRATTSLSKIGEIGGNIVSIILDGLESNLPEILDGANAFFGNFLRQLPKMIDGQSIGNLVTILIDGFVGGIDAVLDNAEMLIDAGAKLIIGIGNGLAAGIPDIIERVPEIIQALADGITNNIDDVILTAETLISALVNALMDPETLEKLVAASINLAGAIMQGLGDGLVAVYDIFNESIGIGFFQDHALEIGKAIMQGIHDGFYSIDELSGIIDFIGGTLGEAYLTIEACVNEITSYVTAAWNGFEAIGGEIYDFIEGIKTGVTAFWAYMVSDLLERVLNIRAALQKIPEKFGELVDSARTWGTDMIQNFIDGITAKWRALQEKVTGVAQLVADYLHFSVPEKGPLADFDKSAPDMMELFAKGIKDNERLIADQFNNSLALLDSPEIGARMAVTGTAGIDSTNFVGETQNAVQSNLSALMAILAEILAAVKAGRIVAIDDTGYRTINEGLARIQRTEERGMLI